MKQGVLNYLYNNYASGEKSWTGRIHHKFIQSPRSVRLTFGMKVLPSHTPNYFDLTTLLLKGVLEKRLRRTPNGRPLEIGVSSFAILSGCISRLAWHTIDAIDNKSKVVESARRHVELNGVDVNVFCSDLFEQVPHKRYDIIFWNLPYYSDPNDYLLRLFIQAPDYMQKTSKLIIGYNSKPLP